jgi:hypothetical protein
MKESSRIYSLNLLLCIKLFIVLLITTSILLFLPSHIIAHQSGCHRWHSCPSDSGSYTCGDLGYPCKYGTYSESGSYVPTYLLPAPVNPGNGNWKYTTSSSNWCNYDLEMSWNKPTSGDRFSISVSKYAGADPGPLVDTSYLSYTFKNITSGKWYVNIKTGNSERWSQVNYWTIDLPKLEPSISANVIKGDGQKDVLQYQINCFKTIYGPDDFINYLKSNDNEPKGDVELNNTYGVFEIKGIDKEGNAHYATLSANLIPTPTSKDEHNSGDGILNIISNLLRTLF